MRPRVLVFGAWDEGPGYPRAPALLESLAPWVDLIPFRVPVRRENRVQLAARPWRWPGFAWRMSRARRQAYRDLQACLTQTRPDLAVVPYPGHVFVHWLRRLYRGPVLLDLFLSAYDTVVEDRRLIRPGSLPARWLKRMDRRACLAADRVLLDTPSHSQRIAAITGLPDARFDWFPLGEVAVPEVAPYIAPKPGERLRVLFFGTGIPLHGLATLLAAVARVESVQLTLVGGSKTDRQMARQLPPDRVIVDAEFLDRAALQQRIEAAHLVAGVFGTSAKADCVIPWKVLHALAAGRPVLTGDTRAVRDWLQPDVGCLVSRVGDVEALATRLAAISAQPQKLATIAKAGLECYQARFSAFARAQRMAEILAAMGLELTSQHSVAAVPMECTV